MNREIKFRAWDNIGKRFVTFPFLVRNDGRVFRQYDGGGHVEDFTLMQFTGLLDKNGKEIYEGDVVQSLHEEYGKNLAGGGKETLVNAEVKWEAPEFLAMYKVAGGLWNMISLPDQCEIIGNIYENPDLLALQSKGDGI